MIIVAIYAAFSAAALWAGENPLRIAFVIAAGAVVFQVAVLLNMARNR